jgi:hypothetical protein
MSVNAIGVSSFPFSTHLRLTAAKPELVIALNTALVLFVCLPAYEYL